jgi:drug/metabolite transporter (DMT)-like permease
VLDALVTIALFLGLATLVTAHVALAARLVLRERPRWRGLVAFVVPPLGVIWALRAGWKALAAVWLGSIFVYALALMVALARA